jgi:charged multivesicular body protein 5
MPTNTTLTRTQHEQIEKRGDNVDVKIKKLDGELLILKKQIATKRGPAKKNLQQRAIRILKQKKMYTKQRDQLYSQQFNIDQTKFATEGLKDNAELVAAMKDAHGTLKTAYKEIDIDEIEDLNEDMSEMMEMSEEVNDMMARSYAVDDMVDDDDLLAELDDLDDELGLEDEEDVPAYLVSANAAANKTDLNTLPSANGALTNEVDEYGLPMVPTKIIS